MPARRTQSARSHATREQILQAALTVFSLKGYAAASMEDVALAAGCSKGGLYHHYGAKSSLLSSVVARLSERGLLLPGEPGQTASSIGRVIIETWAEASRDEALRNQLRDAYAHALDGDAVSPGGLALLLQLGALVQVHTRPEDVDAGDALKRLVTRAA